MLDETAFDLRKYLRRNSASVTVWIALLALILFGLMRYDNFGSADNFSSILN